jgi:putative transposase
MLLSILYQLVRCLLDLAAVLVRRDLSKEAGLLVYGTRTPCCAEEGARVRDTAADRAWLAALSGSCRAAAGPRFSPPLPPRSWPGTVA